MENFLDFPQENNYMMRPEGNFLQNPFIFQEQMQIYQNNAFLPTIKYTNFINTNNFDVELQKSSKIEEENIVKSCGTYEVDKYFNF